MITAANVEACFADMTGYPRAEPAALMPLRAATARGLMRVAEDQLDTLQARFVAEPLQGRDAARMRDAALDVAAIKIVQRRQQLSCALLSS